MSGSLLLAIALTAGVAPGQIDFSSPLNFGGLPNPLAQPAAPAGEPARVEAELVAPMGDRPALLAITVSLAPGYHVYSLTQPAGGPGKSVIRLQDSADFRAVGVFRPTTPPKSHVDYEIWDGLTIEEHFGSVTWYAPIELSDGVDLASLVAQGTVEMQACQENSCEVVAPTFAARLGAGDSVAGVSFGAESAPVGESGAGPLASTGNASPYALNPATLLPLLGAAMLGGLILNLMPCVLPVIGLKVLSFAEQGGGARLRVLGLNLAYSAGLISVFMVLAALAAFAGFGWGELYTMVGFKLGMVFLVFAMGLSFLGVWEIPIPGFAGAGKANDLQAQEGLAGAFYKGVFTTILATPCSGPFLGSAIGFTLTAPAYLTFLVFFAAGLGMALPYLLIGLFPGLVRLIPKPGPWMETFKQLMGFVLMGTVVFLMWSVPESLYLPVLTTLVAIGFACWWIGGTPLTASAQKRTAAWLGGAGVAALVGCASFWIATPSDHQLAWRPYTPVSLATARESGKVVLVDFTADWCLTCKLNLKRAIDTDRVKRVVEANGVEPLLADWTDGGDAIKQKLAELGSRSIPLLAVYPAGGGEPIVLRDLISQDQLLAALAQAGATEGNGAPAPNFDMPQIEIGEAAQAAYR